MNKIDPPKVSNLTTRTNRKTKFLRNASTLLHGDKLIYGGWITHLCFNSEITISKNQLYTKCEYLKFRIINFRKNKYRL